MTDEVDGKILRALQCAPRASFRVIGEVAGVSEQTAARRFHALRRAGVMRVVGLIDPSVHGEARWVARIRCRPDRVGPLADALARRPDIAYAGLASGGSEIICVISAPVHVPRDDVLLRQLPKSASVLDVSIDLLIHPFGTSGVSDWTGYGGHLTPSQIRQLVGDRPDMPTGPPVRLTDEDTPLLDALADDGRATHTQLADVTGWSTARVARRLDALESSGALAYDVELLSARLGFALNATLWLRVAPARLERVGEELAAHDEVAFAAAISGDSNIMVVVICRDTEDLYRYLTTKVAAVPGIDGYGVSIHVHRLKQATSLISRGRLVPPAFA
ncbi:AsnC family transcriptional regulator [Streptomyces sp. NBC_01239]|uniref:Lrp/AsnC family transcriptional regulator n=1 Tax=Streptomyces sp. NBC_01239 TaxID=2903792 RepID=UPI00225BA678|nr:AsnC family transcriptional regulator [Streptomyces sp. NBC_01239]MCX4817018.1 AsnC family transcriptional regulator [Streptomyces sp. NBC_01239]